MQARKHPLLIGDDHIILFAVNHVDMIPPVRIFPKEKSAKERIFKTFKENLENSCVLSEKELLISMMENIWLIMTRLLAMRTYFR